MAQNPKNLLHEKNLLPKKSFGQNFMIDQNINSIITKAVLSLKKGDVEILEIGAGTGSLTAHLLTLGALVHAVERDRDLVPILQEQFRDAIASEKLIIHEASGTTLDYDNVLESDKPGILVGNLPYHLTSTILINLLSCRRFVGAVFLLQKEVAERFLAEPNSKEYGFLTVLLKLAFKIEKVSLVGRNAFWPVPKVDSAIIKLTLVDNLWNKSHDASAILSFVKSIFQKRRKKLSTILKGTFTEDDFQALAIDPNARPETLTPKDFMAMFEHASLK